MDISVSQILLLDDQEPFHNVVISMTALARVISAVIRVQELSCWPLHSLITITKPFVISSILKQPQIEERFINVMNRNNKVLGFFSFVEKIDLKQIVLIPVVLPLFVKRVVEEVKSVVRFLD